MRGAARTFKDHLSCVNAVVFSPNGKMLASASGDRTVKLWDSDTGAVVRTLESHSGIVSGVAFSPDGKLLASASCDGTVKLWDAGMGTVVRTLKCPSSLVWAVSFSPDGKLLASSDRKVRLWDAGTGAALKTLEGHSEDINDIAFSRDGKVLASASRDRTVRLWNVDTGTALQMLEVCAIFRNLSFFRDGSSLKIDRGLLHTISLSNGSVPSRQDPRGIFVKEQWVTRGMEDVLWLPFEYRPSCADIHGNIVALGHASGRVSILEFAP